jgi:hypothetical protein
MLPNPVRTASSGRTLVSGRPIQARLPDEPCRRGRRDPGKRFYRPDPRSVSLWTESLRDIPSEHIAPVWLAWLAAVTRQDLLPDLLWVNRHSEVLENACRVGAFVASQSGATSLLPPEITQEFRSVGQSFAQLLPYQRQIITNFSANPPRAFRALRSGDHGGCSSLVAALCRRRICRPTGYM